MNYFHLAGEMLWMMKIKVNIKWDFIGNFHTIFTQWKIILWQRPRFFAKGGRAAWKFQYFVGRQTYSIIQISSQNSPLFKFSTFISPSSDRISLLAVVFLLSRNIKLIARVFVLYVCDRAVIILFPWFWMMWKIIENNGKR